MELGKTGRLRAGGALLEIRTTPGSRWRLAADEFHRFAGRLSTSSAAPLCPTFGSGEIATVGLSNERLALLGGLWVFMALGLLLIGAIGAPVGSREMVVTVGIAVLGLVLGIGSIAGQRWAARGLIGLTVLFGLLMGAFAVVMMSA